MIFQYTQWEYEHLNIPIPVVKGDKPIIILCNIETYEETETYRNKFGWGGEKKK